MQQRSRNNANFKYILIVIVDTYTNYVWVQALKKKNSTEVTKKNV